MLTHQAKCEKNARSMMKQQAEVYADLKSEALAIKEREVVTHTLSLINYLQRINVCEIYFILIYTGGEGYHCFGT